MKISIQPFTPALEPAAAAFNDRLRTRKAPTAFLLPRQGRGTIDHGAVTATHYLAVDDEGAVRGGMLCQEYPAIVDGEPQRVVNVSAPLSEGIVEPSYALVGPSLIKFAVKQNPLTFVVGMGKIDNPLPRLLKAMGWAVSPVPFFFRMLRPSRCVRQLAPLRTTSARRIAATLAAATGAAAIAGAVVHRASSAATRLASGFDVASIDRWDGEVDGAWREMSARVSFSVERSSTVLPFFYPPDGAGPRAFALRRGGTTEGWFGLLITRMNGNQYFGDLTVATLTDCVGTPGAVGAAPLLAAEQALAGGADIILTNQQYGPARAACHQAGWRPGPTTFMFATSRALGAVASDERAYLTRRDGDGLVNL